MKKRLTRIASLFAVVSLCFSFLCVPASAVDTDYSGIAYIYLGNSKKNSVSTAATATEVSLAFPYSYGGTQNDFLGGGGESVVASKKDYSSSQYITFFAGSIKIPLQNVTDSVVVALSYFWMNSDISGTNESTGGWQTSIPSGGISVEGTYQMETGATGYGYGSASTFTPTPVSWDGVSASDSTYTSSVGLSVSCTFETEEQAENPGSNYAMSDFVVNLPRGYNIYVPCSNVTDSIVSARLYVTSFRVIATSAGPTELEELQNIASGIAQSNEILSAMYGDILAVCNSIYSRLGDIESAVEVIHSYFDTLIPILNSINSTTSNIYNVLNTYFERVLSAIDNQTLTLKEAIQDAESALELYLKPMIDYFNELEEATGESASSLPSHKTDLDGWTSDSSGIDADAQLGLVGILPVFTAFSFIFSILGIFIGLGVFILIIKKGLS